MAKENRCRSLAGKTGCSIVSFNQFHGRNSYLQARVQVSQVPCCPGRLFYRSGKESDVQFLQFNLTLCVRKVGKRPA